MKYRLLSIILFGFGVYQVGKAQAQVGWKLGLHSSVDIQPYINSEGSSLMRSDPSEVVQFSVREGISLLNYTGGVRVGRSLGSRNEISFGLNYVKRVFGINYTNFNLFSEKRYGYLQLPVAFRHYLAGGLIRPYIQAGVSVDYKIAENTESIGRQWPWCGNDGFYDLEFPSLQDKKRWFIKPSANLGVEADFLQVMYCDIGIGYSHALGTSTGSGGNIPFHVISLQAGVGVHL